MKKKAAFDLQNYLITFLIIVGVLVTFGAVATDLGGNYQSITNVTVDSSFSNTYNKLSYIEAEASQLETKLIGGGTGDEEASNTFLGDALSSVKIVFQSFGAAKDMIVDMVKTLHIPVIWYKIFVIGLVLLICTSIVFMIFKSTGKS